MEDNRPPFAPHQNDAPLAEREMHLVQVAGTADTDGFGSTLALWDDVVERGKVRRVGVSIAGHLLTAIRTCEVVER